MIQTVVERADVFFQFARERVRVERTCEAQLCERERGDGLCVSFLRLFVFCFFL